MTKLYEITERHEKALRELSGLGFDADTIADTMEGLEGELIEKSKSVAAYFQNLDADVQAMKDAEARISKRRKTLEKESNGLKEYLRINMEKSGISKIESPEFTVTLRAPAKKVEVYDQKSLPSEFIKTVTTESPDKNAIKRALKEGDVEGARLVDGKSSLTIK